MLRTSRWGRLFSFAPACFARPGREGKSQNLTSLVKRQIEAFDSGASRPDNPLTSVRKHAGTRKGVSEAELVARRPSAKLEEGDVKGAIRLLSSRDTLAPATHATLTSLRALHPSAPFDRRAAPTTSSAPLHTTPQAVLEAITSFPHGSAGGPDGLRPQHLKDLLDGVRGNVGSESVDRGTSGGGPRPIANPLLEAITDLVNLLLSGEVPQFVRASLFGGSITALAKKGGGVRPIVVGYTWRRLAGKVACQLVSACAAALLAPRQLGFGVMGGTEAAVHACRRYVENMPQGHVFVKIDFTNAFQHPAAWRHTQGRRTPHTRAAAIRVSVVQRGQRSAVRGVFAAVTGGGAAGGPARTALLLPGRPRSADIAAVVDCCWLSGRHVDGGRGRQGSGGLHSAGGRRSKARPHTQPIQVWGRRAHQCDALDSGRARGGASGDSTGGLGSPRISTTGRQRGRLRAVIQAGWSGDTGQPTASHAGPRQPLPLAQRCDTPRLMYTLRTAPCTGSKELKLYDEVLRSTLSATLNVDLSDEGWQQASLPVRWGGLGVRGAVMLAPSAYLASAASTATLVLKLLSSCLHHISDRSTPNTLAAWQSAVEPATLAPVDLAATRQRSWDDPCCQRQSTLLLNSAVNDREKARLRASLTATSGAWLQALPISSVGLRMDDDVIRVAVGLRLGANLCEPHMCTCGVPVDARGTHGLACKRSAGRYPRHGLLNDVLWRAMLRAQVPSCKELAGLSRSDGKPTGSRWSPGHEARGSSAATRLLAEAQCRGWPYQTDFDFCYLNLNFVIIY